LCFSSTTRTHCVYFLCCHLATKPGKCQNGQFIHINRPEFTSNLHQNTLKLVSKGISYYPTNHKLVNPLFISIGHVKRLFLPPVFVRRQLVKKPIAQITIRNIVKHLQTAISILFRQISNKMKRRACQSQWLLFIRA